MKSAEKKGNSTYNVVKTYSSIFTFLLIKRLVSNGKETVRMNARQCNSNIAFFFGGKNATSSRKMPRIEGETFSRKA